ncbi:MAG: dockerin type I repeat-containing protein [Candidatus Gottesmanbacteria bacterium]|nr:dockerin type I repeat-containing protein [Candidatus Gottesmanbacteria bacterium]
MRRTIFGWGVLLVLLSGSGLSVSRIAHAEDLTSTNYQMFGPAMNSGGYGTSDNFILFSSISEFAHDRGSASSFTFNPGFVAYPFVSTPVVSATAGNAQVALTWTAAQGFVGWTVSGYDVGQSTTSGGPYTYSSVGNVTSSTRTGLTNSTSYYFVIVPTDAFDNRIATSTQVSATPTAPATPSTSSSGGGGGGGGGGSVSPPASVATVILSGRAYPGSTVTILKDSILQSRVPVQESAAFTSTVSNLLGGTYLFSVYAQDTNGNQSSTITIPVTVVAGVTTSVNGIFLAPTIDVDKSQVKRGNPIRVFGQSSPESTITISVNSDTELFFQTPSDKYGVYSYSFLTSPLEIGNHSTHSNASKSGEVSGASRSVSFAVGAQDILKIKTSGTICGPRGDLNCDGKVNLVDFSIEAYWYKKKGFPVAYDLNSDKAISLIDFSIMASHWTG